MKCHNTALSCTADTMGAFLQYDNDPAVAPMLHDGSNQFNSAKKYILQ